MSYVREDKQSKRKLQTSIVTTIISTSLVLWLLGTLGFLIINARQVANYVKENIGFSLIIHDNIPDADVIKLQKLFEAQPYTKSTRLITKEAAAKELKEELGEDFIEFLGYNPLPLSIEIKLNSDYVNPDSVFWIERSFNRHPEIKEVWYQKNLVQYINDNIRRISIIILGFASLLLVISIVLLNNTIRLAVYSKRFIINTMKLVGATNSFIRLPFVRSGMWQGLTSGVVASGLLYSSLYVLNSELPELRVFDNPQLFSFLFVGMILTGAVITTVSTFFSVNKYLRMKTNQLYI